MENRYGKMKGLPNLKKDPIGATIVLAFLQSFRMILTDNSITSRSPNEDKTLDYKIMDTNKDELTLDAEGNKIILQLLDSMHLIFKEEGKMNEKFFLEKTSSD